MKKFFIIGGAVLLAAALIYLVWWLIAPPEMQLGGSGSSDGSGGNNEDQKEVAYNTQQDESNQEFVLREREKRAVKRFPGDTLDLMRYILESTKQTGEKGTYLVDQDPTFQTSWPQSAVIYFKDGGSTYIFALIAKSKTDERVVEVKNLVGYNPSFIDLDSTELGTAFFYLTLFKYEGGSFSTVWEKYTPTHGGFNKMYLERWGKKNVPALRINFHYGEGPGHINYTYYLLNGFTNLPHLLMTYQTINARRVFADINNDEYPDYYEGIYLDTGDRIEKIDSVGFIWVVKDSLYRNVRNPKQFAPY